MSCIGLCSYARSEEQAEVPVTVMEGPDFEYPGSVEPGVPQPPPSYGNSDTEFVYAPQRGMYMTPNPVPEAEKIEQSGAPFVFAYDGPATPNSELDNPIPSSEPEIHSEE
ncbi:uncharacterized protein LOC102807794 [Saccoglossus kowalevskii]|uniref:Uncharacterized protein LOC102807794 n=1 Tax=Saccoglossus kowalevskii TaxID=10224 RepID=A0ABM0M5W2_SACKO|nr:PREDICTED: uncharacterized protein LOC102807794 [Saccoglossus kowalevskii]